MTYNGWDVVAVPFPFTEKNTTKKRPALVINKPDYQCKTGHVVLLMITSAKNSSWYSDVDIEDLTVTGLKKPSLVRFKVFSLDERVVLKKIGFLSEADKEKIKVQILNTIDV